MMEFFLSKVWLFVCGIAVTAVLVMAFSGMDHAVSDGESQRRVDQLADTLDSASELTDLQITIAISDYLPDAGSMVKISKGFVSLVEADGLHHAPLRSELILHDCQGTAVESSTLVQGDKLVIRKDPSAQNRLLVQVAKERTVSLTA